MNRQRRRVFLTFMVAGVVAVIGDHMIKPTLKRRLHV